MFSLESPHRSDSNENTIYHFQYKKENHPKLSQICSYGIFHKELKNEFKTAICVRATEGLLYGCVDDLQFSTVFQS